MPGLSVDLTINLNESAKNRVAGGSSILFNVRIQNALQGIGNAAATFKKF